MPSNENLRKAIIDIDENADLEGATNAEMVEILKGLRLQQSILALDENADIAEKSIEELTAMLVELQPEDAAAKNAAEVKAVATKKKAEDAKNAKKSPFTIAKGKAITTKRGILGEGDEIKIKDLEGGKEAIDSFVKSGHIDKN